MNEYAGTLASDVLSSAAASAIISDPGAEGAYRLLYIPAAGLKSEPEA